MYNPDSVSPENAKRLNDAYDDYIRAAGEAQDEKDAAIDAAIDEFLAATESQRSRRDLLITQANDRYHEKVGPKSRAYYKLLDETLNWPA